MNNTYIYEASEGNLSWQCKLKLVGIHSSLFEAVIRAVDSFAKRILSIPLSVKDVFFSIAFTASSVLLTTRRIIVPTPLQYFGLHAVNSL